MHHTDTAPQTTWSIELPHTAAAVPIARALIRSVLTELESPAANTDTAELLTAELVANAVLHTRGETPIELVVELMAAGFQVEVHDGDPEPVHGLGDELPAPAEAEPDANIDLDEQSEGGRGLLLIRALSKAAGYRPTPHGKAVWFTLPVR